VEEKNSKGFPHHRKIEVFGNTGRWMESGRMNWNIFGNVDGWMIAWMLWWME